MALEVRFVPPRLLPVALAALLLSLPVPANPQQNQPSGENWPDVAAKARLLQDLDRQIEQRRRELAREEEALAALNRALEAARANLVEERQRLEGLRAEIEDDIARRDQLVDQRLAQIARVYGAMKPREAAAALEEMDDDMAVAILERLPGRSVGKIFDLMPKDRVRELTRRLEQGASKE